MSLGFEQMGSIKGKPNAEGRIVSDGHVLPPQQVGFNSIVQSVAIFNPGWHLNVPFSDYKIILSRFEDGMTIRISDDIVDYGYEGPGIPQELLEFIDKDRYTLQPYVRDPLRSLILNIIDFEALLRNSHQSDNALLDMKLNPRNRITYFKYRSETIQPTQVGDEQRLAYHIDPLAILGTFTSNIPTLGLRGDVTDTEVDRRTKLVLEDIPGGEILSPEPYGTLVCDGETSFHSRPIIEVSEPATRHTLDLVRL